MHSIWFVANGVHCTKMFGIHALISLRYLKAYRNQANRSNTPTVAVNKGTWKGELTIGHVPRYASFSFG